MPSAGSLSAATQLKENSRAAESYHDLLSAITPLDGELQALRTKAESESGLELVYAHIVCVQAQDGNNALKMIDSILPSHAISHLQHLRRVAKPEYLPPCVKYQIDSGNSGSSEHSPLPSPVLPSSSLMGESSSASSSRSSSRSRRGARRRGSSSKRKIKLLYLIAAPISLVSLEKLTCTLQAFAHTAYIFPVPATPPSSHEAAEEWSKNYWPTIYKSYNPFGPQPVFVSKAREAIDPYAGLWMKIAQEVAYETYEKGYGEQFGAVIVDSHAGFEGPLPVAAAGDARWEGYFRGDLKERNMNVAVKTPSIGRGCENGNPAAHAALRAIGMVAMQRVALSTERGDRTGILSLSSNLGGFNLQQAPNIFVDAPLTHLERVVFNRSPLPAGGYLCSGLEIWMTHEPCVMCSMAILHSRFERVVFGKRMPETGGLIGDRESLGYGLFWRPELNWKMLGWEWIQKKDKSSNSSIKDDERRKVHI